MNDIKRLKAAVEKYGHKVTFESRDIQDESGYWTKKKRGWWMGNKFIGSNASDALIYIGEDA